MAQSQPQPEPSITNTAAAPQKTVLVSFAVVELFCLLLTVFYFRVMLPSMVLYSVPQFCLLLVVVIPILLWQTIADRALSRKVSIWSSAIIWVLGIAIAFILKPTSPFIAMSDGMLLLGFIPLLYLWRFSIPWIVFGGFNLAIGIFLLLLSLLADSHFPSNLWGPKHHLAEYHPYMMWLLFGFATLVFGVFRLFKNIALMGMRGRKPSPDQ